MRNLPLLLLAAALLSACATVPRFPEPQPDTGQLLLHLEGQPREGVGGPARRTVFEPYNIRNESVERGAAFERVNYRELEDIVVILRRDDDEPFHLGPRGTTGSCSGGPSVDLTVTAAGFDRGQYVADGFPFGEQVFQVVNRRAQALDFFFIALDGDVHELHVPARSSATIPLHAGTYEIECDQDERLTATAYALNQAAGWIGSSRQRPFFDHLPPGRYRVAVHPPRLPVWEGTLDVSAGTRSELRVPLGVNELPRLERD